MKSQTFYIILGLIICIASTRCIHLNLGDTSPTKAHDLVFEAPPFPFIPFKDEESDRSWQSQKTGNIIAIYSNCSQKADKPLTLALSELSKGFDRIDTNEHSSLFFQGREAVLAKMTGIIDGINVAMETVILNKNKCYYQLTYSGVAKQFEKEMKFFEQFKENFKAP